MIEINRLDCWDKGINVFKNSSALISMLSTNEDDNIVTSTNEKGQRQK